MNKIIGFIKANLVVVILVVLILAVLPTGYIFSNKWNKKVHDEANAAYTKEQRSLTKAGKINYSLPAVLEGEANLSETRAPNSAVTAFYEAHKREREEQVNEVVERGTAFNQGDHVELVPGILPKASDDRTLVRLAREMIETIVGTNATPSIYQRKLQRLNAGSPPTPERLTLTLEEIKKREQQGFEDSNADGKMTQAQSDQLQKDLVAHRLGEYIGRAKALTFYCSPAAFVNGEVNQSSNQRQSNNANKGEFSIIPASSPPLSTIDESLVFNWLWDYWIVSDVLDAAALANTDPQTGAMSIPDAPLKRIEQIRISKLDFASESTASAATDDSQTGIRTNSRNTSRGNNASNATLAQDDGSATFTGRKGGEPGSAYDIRTIQVVVVASSQGLPAFIDAIARTDYMTVTDLDLEQVDVWSDLEDGYYYGDEHVVRASITIESVWLRSWLAPIMPDQVKSALGIPLAVNPEESDG